MMIRAIAIIGLAAILNGCEGMSDTEAIELFQETLQTLERFEGLGEDAQDRQQTPHNSNSRSEDHGGCHRGYHPGIPEFHCHGTQ